MLLVVLPREYALTMPWPVSEDVELASKPERVYRGTMVSHKHFPRLEHAVSDVLHVWGHSLEDWAELLPALPRSEHEALAEITSADTCAEAQSQLQKLCQGLLEARQTPAQTLREVWVEGKPDAPRGLLQALTRPVVVQALPFDPPPTLAPWRSALAALTARNVGEQSLSYDDWRNAVFAVHHETAGSEEGLQLAHALSAASPKYDPSFLDERVWPYVKPGGGITGRTLMRMAGLAGWHQELSADAFPFSPDEAPTPAEAGDSSPGTVGGAPVRIKRGTIPEAQHLCTDQRNAERIKNAYGGHILVSAGRWYVWQGTHWATDEADVYRYACKLSVMVRDEADKREQALAGEDPKSEFFKQGMAIVEALRKWGTRCEMGSVINAAVALLRKMLTVEPSDLDRDPWALNCANGTVDLRDGSMRPHDYRDLITKLAPVRYVPGVHHGEHGALWLRTITEVYSGDPHVVEFAQRWFGYCATGSVREQVFVVHWGGGSNGKSTVVESVAGVLGNYAYTAPPGLMSGQVHNERHPTEIAGLMGKRMVTTVETDEGAKLREGFVKQATGGDRLTARFMREDFFEFLPTHKLQVLQNPKLNTDGTDHGLWRRVRLLPYTQVFGTPEEIAARKATRLKDLGLSETLRSEAMREVVLAWLIEGAVRWFEGGLTEPETVMLAGKALQAENNRVGQFLLECCELGVDLHESLTVPGRGGLYHAYEVWCAEGGSRPFAKRRFLNELEPLVPMFRQESVLISAMGRRVKVQRVWGISLLKDNDLGAE